MWIKQSHSKQKYQQIKNVLFEINCNFAIDTSLALRSGGPLVQSQTMPHLLSLMHENVLSFHFSLMGSKLILFEKILAKEVQDCTS